MDWELFDNYTRSKLVHGKSRHGNQRYETVAACKAEHPVRSCYETNMAGVYSDYFEIQLTKGERASARSLLKTADFELFRFLQLKSNAMEDRTEKVQ